MLHVLYNPDQSTSLLLLFLLRILSAKHLIDGQQNLYHVIVLLHIFLTGWPLRFATDDSSIIVSLLHISIVDMALRCATDGVTIYFQFCCTSTLPERPLDVQHKFRVQLLICYISQPSPTPFMSSYLHPLFPSSSSWIPPTTVNIKSRVSFNPISDTQERFLGWAVLMGFIPSHRFKMKSLLFCFVGW